MIIKDESVALSGTADHHTPEAARGITHRFKHRV
jgi:hypothetical protein